MKTGSKKEAQLDCPYHPQVKIKRAYNFVRLCQTRSGLSWIVSQSRSQSKLMIPIQVAIQVHKKFIIVFFFPFG
jgi:hypothetical protein